MPTTILELASRDGYRMLASRRSHPESTLCDNNAHSVACFEITPGVSDDFPARRVIRCLDSHDFGYEIGVFLLGERDELVFGRGRSDNKDRVDAIESSCDV